MKTMRIRGGRGIAAFRSAPSRGTTTVRLIASITVILGAIAIPALSSASDPFAPDRCMPAKAFVSHERYTVGDGLTIDLGEIDRYAVTGRLWQSTDSTISNFTAADSSCAAPLWLKPRGQRTRIRGFLNAINSCTDLSGCPEGSLSILLEAKDPASRSGRFLFLKANEIYRNFDFSTLGPSPFGMCPLPRLTVSPTGDGAFRATIDQSASAEAADNCGASELLSAGSAVTAEIYSFKGTRDPGYEATLWNQSAPVSPGDDTALSAAPQFRCSNAAEDHFLAVGLVFDGGAGPAVRSRILGDPVVLPCDPDRDGLLSTNDNCSLVSNADQADRDSDGVGDVCDVCPGHYDPLQDDTDDDGLGNVCDQDDDNDGIRDQEDVCPLIVDPNQTDTDGDGAGDPCDRDDDDDGIRDEEDLCPLVFNPEQEDLDYDRFAVCSGDCDDSDPWVYPGAPQRCDGRNDDCNNESWPQIPSGEMDVNDDGCYACFGECTFPEGYGVLSAISDLTVSKVGDDVVLTWTGTGTTYDGARATDAPFTNATTLFRDQTTTSHTYAGAVNNPRTLEFFDVTDDTEPNRGGNWNGGVLPPAPPVIDTGDPLTNLGSLFTGSAGVIRGSGFSIIATINMICFDGGVCTQATSASPNEVQFITPPGAHSGPATVSVGPRTSDPANAIVALENPASELLDYSSITFSRQDNSYWIVGVADAVTSMFRLYFDIVSQRWIHEDRGGAFSGSIEECSAQTSRTGRAFCIGDDVGSDHHTRVVDTSPPSDVVACITLQPISGHSMDVSAVAVDPDLNAQRAEVAYFATEEDVDARIRKIAGNCSAVLDDNYGNFAMPGGVYVDSMVVDPINGDLYYSWVGEIWRITTAQSVSRVRVGLPGNTLIVGLNREGVDDPGTLLLRSGGSIYALARDNLNADPIPVASASGYTLAGFGAQVSGGPWLNENVNRTVVFYLEGTSLILEPHPLIDVTISGPLPVRISSPNTTEELPKGQTWVPSSTNTTGRSHAITTLLFRDGLARTICASVGDPGPGAPQYDPTPPEPLECHTPRAQLPTMCPQDSTPHCCDNMEEMQVGGAGTFIVGGGLVSCKTCGSAENPCSWKFRTTRRYAGDNYKVFFSFDQDAERFAATSDVYTAWKHLHVEQDRMFRKGGLLFQDFDPNTCGQDCDKIIVWDWTSIDRDTGVAIAIFDQENTYESQDREERTIESIQDNEDGTLTITLNANLTKEYIRSPYPQFNAGRAAGFGQIRDADGSPTTPLFFESDLSNRTTAYDDALTDFHVAKYGAGGSGTVPFVPEFSVEFVEDTGLIATSRFHQLWFSNKQAAQCIIGVELCVDCCNTPQNYFHSMGIQDTDANYLGVSLPASDASWTMVEACENDCGSCTAEGLPTLIRNVGNHEFGHLFEVNVLTVNDGHDDNDAWCGHCGGAIGQKCIMNVSASLEDRVDGIDRFDCYNLIQNEAFCGDTYEAGEGIRVMVDPR